MTLDWFLSQTHEPGSNRGDGRGTPMWRFLLPHPRPDTLAWVGTPPPRLDAEIRSWGTTVRSVPDVGTGRALLAGGDVAAVIATGRGADEVWRSVSRRFTLAAQPAEDEVAASAVPEDGVGAVALEEATGWESGVIGKAGRVSGRLIGRVAPATGAKLRSAFSAPVLTTSLQPSPAAIRPRRAPVLLLTDDALPPAPPSYVRDALAASGHAGITRWRLLPHRGFRSQKIVFLCEDRAVAVKVAQDVAMSGRLQHEIDALRAVADGSLAPAGAQPTIQAATSLDGLVVAVEDAVTGRAFREAGSEGPHVVAATRYLDEVARLSAHPADDVLAALNGVVRRFADGYPDDRSIAFLREQMAVLERLRPLPVCLSHGDYGNWNLVLPPGGGVGVLDWENGEVSGIPGWDQIYFAQTLGTLRAEETGVRYRPETFIEQMLRDGPPAELLISSLARLAAIVDLPRGSLPPLASLCWAHWAVRELPRLDPAKRGRGRYRGFVAALASHQDSPVMRRLADLGTP